LSFHERLGGRVTGNYRPDGTRVQDRFAVIVIPAQAGIYLSALRTLDTRLLGYDERNFMPRFKP